MVLNVFLILTFILLICVLVLEYIKSAQLDKYLTSNYFLQTWSRSILPHHVFFLHIFMCVLTPILR